MTCVRKATASDLEAVEGIYNELHQAEEDGQITVGWVRGVYPTRAMAEAALERGGRDVGLPLGRQSRTGCFFPFGYRAEVPQ